MKRIVWVQTVLWVSFLALPALFLAGCGDVSYPKEKVIASLIDICQKEYKVKVTAKIVGSNLGVRLNFPSLFGDNFDFKEEALNVLEDVLTSVRRVCLSTDSNFDFYTIVGADQNNGVELVMTRNILDLKLVMYGNIGRNDYAQRMMLRVRPDISIMGDRKLRKFFTDMATGKIERIISNNFAPGTTLKDISSSFFLSLLELGMKDDIKFNIVETKCMPTGPEEGLFYCKVQETYKAKTGYETNTFTFPSGFEYEYLFVVTCKDFIPGIRKVIPLSSTDGVKNAKGKFPQEYSRYENVAGWDSNDFYQEEVTMPEFLAQQIAQRIRTKINANKVTKEQLNIEVVEGNFSTLRPDAAAPKEAGPVKPNYELILRFKKKMTLQPDETKPVSKELVTISLAVIKEVCESYHYENFTRIKLLGSNNEELVNVDRVMGTKS